MRKITLLLGLFVCAIGFANAGDGIIITSNPVDTSIYDGDEYTYSDKLYVLQQAGFEYDANTDSWSPTDQFWAESEMEPINYSISSQDVQNADWIGLNSLVTMGTYSYDTSNLSIKYTSGDTTTTVNDLSFEDKTSALEILGYQHDADSNEWTVADSPLYEVDHIYALDAQTLNAPTIEAMSDVEFQTMLTEIGLSASGYKQDTENPGTWVFDEPTDWGNVADPVTTTFIVDPETGFANQTVSATDVNYNDISAEERAVMLDVVGYTYDADTGEWVADPAEWYWYDPASGEFAIDYDLSLYEAGVERLTPQQISAMSDVEFNTLMTQIGLTRAGYVENTNNPGVWYNADDNTQSVIIDPSTGNAVAAPPDDNDGNPNDPSWFTTGEGGPSPMNYQYDGIVPCGKAGDECTLCQLVELAQRLINALIFLATLVAALLFLYAGVLYVFAPASLENIKRAHTVFKSALIGFVVVLAAWLIIHLFMAMFIGSPLADSIGGVGERQWGEILCKQ